LPVGDGDLNATPAPGDRGVEVRSSLRCNRSGLPLSAAQEVCCRLRFRPQRPDTKGILGERPRPSPQGLRVAPSLTAAPQSPPPSRTPGGCIARHLDGGTEKLAAHSASLTPGAAMGNSMLAEEDWTTLNNCAPIAERSNGVRSGATHSVPARLTLFGERRFSLW
jgi:hypothetical protein